MVIATIFCELMHHLTKLAYGAWITHSAGGGISVVELAESLEELLVGCRVEVLWNLEDVSKMEKIIGLVVEYHGAPGNLCEQCPDHIYAYY
jgi:hypothetical protein